MFSQFRHDQFENAPVVALHSSASNSSQWRSLTADLENHFEVHAYDLPGYGRTPLSADHSQSGVAAIALPVVRKIEELNAPVHLVGHSNGAGIAIKVALLRPELVKSLTLYEPATFHFLKSGDQKDQTLFSEIQQVAGLVTAAAATENAAAGMQQFLDFWNGDGFWDSLTVSAKQNFSRMINAIISDFAAGFSEIWQLKDLSSLEMPSLVMMGLESPEVAQRAAAAVSGALTNSRIALLPELGHMAPIFQPEWVNSRIFEHIANVEKPAVAFSWPIKNAA